MPKVILHISNEDPVVGEIESLPSTNDTLLVVKHPTLRSGKDLPYLEQSVSTVIWPMSRINFIEVLPSSDEEEIITFIRE
jgi:hypothetical protein